LEESVQVDFERQLAACFVLLHPLLISAKKKMLLNNIPSKLQFGQLVQFFGPKKTVIESIHVCNREQLKVPLDVPFQFWQQCFARSPTNNVQILDY
jgi:hypothetical protein